MHEKGFQRTLKAILDKLGAGFLLIVLTPLLLLGMVLVYFDLGRPIFFIQPRPGLGGKPFNLYKLRTMKPVFEGSEEKRITKMGKFLRSSSIDEIPQLFNILIGQMSLVGPRPLLMEYLAHYDEIQMKRHDVLPGVTGLAQIEGRNLLSWEEKFQLDIKYVENWNIGLDIRILIKTFIVVLTRHGVETTYGAIPAKFSSRKGSRE